MVNGIRARIRMIVHSKPASSLNSDGRVAMARFHFADGIGQRNGANMNPPAGQASSIRMTASGFQGRRMRYQGSISEWLCDQLRSALLYGRRRARDQTNKIGLPRGVGLCEYFLQMGLD